MKYYSLIVVASSGCPILEPSSQLKGNKVGRPAPPHQHFYGCRPHTCLSWNVCRDAGEFSYGFTPSLHSPSSYCPSTSFPNQPHRKRQRGRHEKEGGGRERGMREPSVCCEDACPHVVYHVYTLRTCGNKARLSVLPWQLGDIYMPC